MKTPYLIEKYGSCSIIALLRAVAAVQKKWGREKREPGPGSDQYYMSTKKFRPVMLEAVEHEWCRQAGAESYLFPFSDDIVAYVWMDFRKLDSEMKERVLQYIDGATMF